MSRWHSYLNSAIQVLSNYTGEEPFSSFLKKFFSANKKYGSKDRRQVSQLCYSYFRLGKALRGLAIEERIETGLFLCSNEPNELLENLKPDWNKEVRFSLKDKISNFRFQISDVFPWKEELSEGMDHSAFCESFFTQPDLFLRLRPGKEKQVISKLQDAGVEFKQINNSCISLPNASKIENIIELNNEAVVQDYSSQSISEFFYNIKQSINHKLNVWDCCAASGGKSILAKDILGNIDLTVSDVRQSILVNLKKRFKEAGIVNYKSFIADLASADFRPSFSGYDLIIADVPCTGSGTWSRTPEQLFWFEKGKIDEYATLQKKIVANINRYLRPGGFLLYITCSVFKKENEELIKFLEQEAGFEIVKMKMLKGYDKKADTLFAALLKKQL